MGMFSLEKEKIAALFANFRGPPDVFGPFHPPQFGTYNADAEEEVAELASLLYCVQTAGQRFRIVSLGAAPGEWAVRTERAYRKKFPNGDFRSVNLEGDLGHFEMTKTFVAENGGNVSDNVILYKVIADRDGWAYFPIINSDIDWGAGVAAVSESQDDLSSKITISDMARADREGANGGKPLQFRTVPAVSLSTLLAETGAVDYLHSDIQGAEGDVFPGQMEALTRWVRICCIGTHGTAIQNKLVDAFARNGWIMECGYSCGVSGEGESERCLKDGVYVWSNPHYQTS